MVSSLSIVWPLHASYMPLATNNFKERLNKCIKQTKNTFFFTKSFTKKFCLFSKSHMVCLYLFYIPFKHFKTSLGSVWSSLLRTGSAGLTEPGSRALTVKTIPRAPTVRDYSMGEIQEVWQSENILLEKLKNWLWLNWKNEMRIV